MQEKPDSPSFLHNPIPGYGWTGEPGAMAWERPPMYVSLEDVVDYYSDKMTEVDIIGDLLDTIEKNVPLMTIADGMIKMGIMEGKHSIDAGFLVKPVLIEMMIAMAEINDVGFVIEEEDYMKMKMMPTKLVEKVVGEAQKAAADFANAEPVEQEEPVGLMARRSK